MIFRRMWIIIERVFLFKEGNVQIIGPASIPQELFLNSDEVDIVFYGGNFNTAPLSSNR